MADGVANPMAWQPTRVERFVRAHNTSMQTAEIVTDAGRAYIKAMGNPEGPHGLACEWVGTQLAHWFGLRTFDFAIVPVTDIDEIEFHQRGIAAPGPAFVTRAESGHVWDGAAADLATITNPTSLTRLIVFDTWTRNCDRYSERPDGPPRRNRDNLFFSAEGSPAGRFTLVAMDHTHVFTCGRELTRSIAQIGTVRDTAIYGAFPEFADIFDVAECSRALSRLAEFSPQIAAPFIDSIPREWDVAVEVRAALSDFICGRARYVAGRSPDDFRPQPPAPPFQPPAGEGQP